MGTLITLESGYEVLLSDSDIEHIAEEYNWPYEWQVASKQRRTIQNMQKSITELEAENEKLKNIITSLNADIKDASINESPFFYDDWKASED